MEKVEKLLNWFETHTKTRILLGFIAGLVIWSGCALSVIAAVGLWAVFAPTFVRANPFLAIACVCGSWGLAGAAFGTLCDILALYARRRLDRIQEERATGDDELTEEESEALLSRGLHAVDGGCTCGAPFGEYHDESCSQTYPRPPTKWVCVNEACHLTGTTTGVLYRSSCCPECGMDIVEIR